MKSALLLIPSSLFIANVALAQSDKASFDDALKLDTLVITANRNAEPTDQTNAAVTIFTRKDIDRLQPSSVSDLISKVPGVQVTQAGGKGSTTGVYIRGTKTAQTLILIDGQRVGTASAGGATLQYLAIDQVERVEVLRGSRSAIYGADAIGGVIQIFTRRGEKEGINPRFRFAAGNKGTRQYSAGLSGGKGATRFSFNASLDETQGIDRTVKSWPTDKDHDAYRNQSFSFNVNHQLTDDIEVGLTSLHQQGKSEFDNPAGWTPSKYYTAFNNNSTSAYINAYVNEFYSTRLELGHAEDKQKTRDKLDKQDIWNNYEYNTFRDSASWVNTFNLNDTNTLLLGADFLNDKLHSSSDYARTSRWNRAGFLQHSYQGDVVFTELGLRHDKSQQYGSKNTWNASIGFHINPENKLIFSYAEGFRVPNFNDAYAPPGWGADPNLKPEQSKNYEIQWKSQLAEKTYFEAAIYRTVIKDMINSVELAGGIYAMYNVDKARINGFEASLKHEVYGWQGELGVSMIDPRDSKTGHTLQNRARRTLNLDVDRQFGSFSVGASWMAVSSSYGDAANTETIPGFGLLGVRGSWQATPTVKFDAKIDNLLDKSYYRYTYAFKGQSYGYREEGIMFLFGVTWTPSFK